MEDKILNNTLKLQREFVKSRKMLDVKQRIKALKELKKNIELAEDKICEALNLDLGKSKEESYMSEIGIVYSEINYMLSHIKEFSEAKYVHTPLSNFPASSYVKPYPYGMVLVMSPWNYPFLLAIEPVVDAVASGNSVILRPSSITVNVSNVIKEIVEKAFERGHVDVVLGGHDVSNYLLEQKFDYIFYTGSTNVGKMVMEKAFKHLTPVTLEMGGKSPCIVDKTANIKLSAKRIVFGKLLNCGQTCVAPDYILCEKSIKDELIYELKRQIILQYTTDPLTFENYPRIVSQKQFDRLSNLLDNSKIIFGGRKNAEKLKIEPTLVEATYDDLIMQEEIFGPILPILTFESIDEVVTDLAEKPKPLAFYIFSRNKKTQKYLESHCDFGGGCINDTIMHIANSRLPFGGVGDSGMGFYHGQFGFDTFSHYKGMVKKSNTIDLPLRYQKIGKTKYKMIKTFLK